MLNTRTAYINIIVQSLAYLIQAKTLANVVYLCMCTSVCWKRRHIWILKQFINNSYVDCLYMGFFLSSEKQHRMCNLGWILQHKGNHLIQFHNILLKGTFLASGYVCILTKYCLKPASLYAKQTDHQEHLQIQLHIFCQNTLLGHFR